MEGREKYGRASVDVRIRDIERLMVYAKAADISTTEALDNVISLGLKARWEELDNIRFKEFEEAGYGEKNFR